MSKHPIDEKTLKKVIATTQAIEGYAEVSDEVKQKVKELKAKHGIKVSPRK
jgi:hypothetical protein